MWENPPAFLTYLRLDDAGPLRRLGEDSQSRGEAVEAMAHPQGQVRSLGLQDIKQAVKPVKIEDLPA